MGTDWSPVGQIYFFTLHSTNPQYDVMDLKSLEDWVVEKQFKSVPNVVDVASFGGPTREYQVRVDPNKLIAYGLSIGQVEQQLTNNNTNAGGSFIEAGLQQINVREVGLVRNVHDIENTVITTKNGTPLQITRHRDRGAGAEDPAGPVRARDPSGERKDRRQRRRGQRHRAAAQGRGIGFHAGRDPRQSGGARITGILPPGVTVVPFLDRSDLVHLTTHTVLHNLTEGIILVVIILFVFLGNVRGALIVALTIPFSLLFAATCLKLQAHSGESAVAGRARFRHGGGWRGGDGGEHRPPPGPCTIADDTRSPLEKIREAAHEVQRPVFYAIGIIITAYMPIFTLQRVEGRLFKPMAWTVAFALLGALMFSMLLAPVLSSILFRKGAKEWHNPVMEFLTRACTAQLLAHGDPLALGDRRRLPLAGFGFAMYLATSVIGSEFLPHLDEGAIWVRGTLAPSTGPTEGIAAWPTRRALMLCSFPGSHRSAPARWAVPTTAPTPPAFSTPNISST